MKQSFGLHHKLSQSLTITPQMIQTLKIIQYSTPELLDHIQHELAENPFLTEESNPAETNESSADFQDEKDHYLEYADYLEKPLLPEKKSQLTSTHDKSLIIEQTAQAVEQLSDVLMDQLNYHYQKNSEEYKIGEFIIGSLDKDGYLNQNLIDEYIAQLNIGREDFDEVHKVIKDFEPAGIAAFDLKECLLKQVEKSEAGKNSIEYSVIDKCFQLLEKKKYKEIAKEMEFKETDIDFAIHNISLLEPKPGRKYQPLDNTVVIPDVIVIKENNRFQLYINEEHIPKIEFNEEYKNLLKIKNNPELSKYIHDKEDKAKTLLSSIKYRVSNLQKVMERILVVQADFFNKGTKFLNPYTLVKLSEEININQGTLSRVVNSKYIQTEWGTFSLRIFFSSSISSVEGDVSSNKIKEIIKEIILEYEGTKKLSDQKIAEALEKKGYKVARRTVSKYRKALKILSSFHR